jgi:hypothetical protein
MAFFSRIKAPAAVLWALLLGLASSCVTPYMADVPAATQDYLVVNGFINSQGVTTIQLMRSLSLQAKKAPAAEAKAAVVIQTAGSALALPKARPAPILRLA